MAIGDLKDANVTGELEGSGLAFGELIKKVGEAVADTSRKLDDTSAKTAVALGNTLVNVIAVRETVYNDDGTAEESISHVRQLPALSVVDSPFYEWRQVRVQGVFVAQEITTASTSVTANAGMSSKVNFGYAGALRLGLGHKDSGSIQAGTADSSQDLSLGTMRLFAQLAPKQEGGVPRPRQVVQGPRLTIFPGQILDVKDQDGKLAARTMDVVIEYRQRDGAAIPGRSIAIDTNGIGWKLTSTDPDPHLTDVEGRLHLALRREFLGEEPDTTPINFVVTARVGLVDDNVTVTF